MISNNSRAHAPVWPPAIVHYHQLSSTIIHFELAQMLHDHDSWWWLLPFDHAHDSWWQFGEIKLSETTITRSLSSWDFVFTLMKFCLKGCFFHRSKWTISLFFSGFAAIFLNSCLLGALGCHFANNRQTITWYQARPFALTGTWGQNKFDCHKIGGQSFYVLGFLLSTIHFLSAIFFWRFSLFIFSNKTVNFSFRIRGLTHANYTHQHTFLPFYSWACVKFK